MTKAEIRNSKEYIEYMDDIKKRPKGSEFYVVCKRLSRVKQTVLDDCINNGILATVSFTLNFNGDLVEQRYKRFMF